MERKEKNSKTAGITVNRQKFVFTLLAIVPVFFAFYFYADSVVERYDEGIAALMTIFFITCIYAGGYLSFLLVNKDKSISGRTLTYTGVAVIFSAGLFLLITQATLSFRLDYLRFLFTGIPFIIFSLCLGAMAKLVRSHISNQLAEAKAVAEQSQGELKFLQNQLSPHFLFNTLNNMYGISLTQQEKIPGLLLKLSDLLRYSVYDAKELFVPLKNEVAYIKDYIDFEKIRIGEKLVLEESYEEVDATVKIAPMLLIVFVENAFKHSKNTAGERIYINIRIQTWGNSVLFTVKNSFDSKETEKSMINRDSGFGLENVAKRLEILYKDDFDLQTQKKDGFYTVMLQLKLR